MSEVTGYQKPLRPYSNNLEANTPDTLRDIAVQQWHNYDNLSEHRFQYQSTRIQFQGPYQDDSTYAVIGGLRTVLARFFIWVNLPLCWLVGVAIATRRIEQWLHAHFAGPESTVAIAFVGVYVVYTVLSHTLAVFAAIGYELWWNPYARAPTLRGEVGKEEEVAMVKQNRAIARRIGRTFLPCLS